MIDKLKEILSVNWSALNLKRVKVLVAIRRPIYKFTYTFAQKHFTCMQNYTISIRLS